MDPPGPIHLRTLGGAEARPSGAPDGVPLQAKRLALLAYLAAAPHERWTRRDTLLALLWPDVDAERGRTSLRRRLAQG